jgi:hypothetical protein
MIDTDRIIEEQGKFEPLGCEWGYDDITEFSLHIANLVRKEEVIPLKEEYANYLRDKSDELAALKSGIEPLRAKAEAWDNFVSLQTGDVQEMANKAKDYDALKTRIAGGIRVYARSNEDNQIAYISNYADSGLFPAMLIFDEQQQPLTE